MRTLSPKEKKYVEILKVRNAIKSLHEEKTIDLDEYVETYNFASYVRSRKLAELETEYEIALEALDAEKKDAARREWLNTDEGKSYMEAHKKAKDDIRKAFVEATEEARKHVRAFIQKLLGTEFDLIYFNESSFQVGLVKEYTSDNRPVAYFGHTFEVYYGKFLDKCKYELNYGTMGSFELGVDMNRTKFLEGLGKFAKGGFQSEFKEYLMAFNAEFRRLLTEKYKLEREFEEAGSK